MLRLTLQARQPTVQNIFVCTILALVFKLNSIQYIPELTIGIMDSPAWSKIKFHRVYYTMLSQEED